MGVSTDGVLCYGFRLKDEEGGEEEITIKWLCKEPVDGEEEGEEMSFDDFLAGLFGLKQPGSFNTQQYDTDIEYKKMWVDYWAQKRQLEEEVGVVVVRHCSGDYPMYILAAKASVKTASRGNPIELGQSLIVQNEWREKIRVFCEKANIPFEEPQLILCSYWS